MRITIKQLKQLVKEVRSSTTFDAGTQWDAMSEHERLVMLNSEMDGYSSKDRVDLSRVSWAELPEQVGHDMMDEFARVVMHWSA